MSFFIIYKFWFNYDLILVIIDLDEVDCLKDMGDVDGKV